MITSNHPSISTVVFKKSNNTPKVAAKLLWKCGIFRLINFKHFFFQRLKNFLRNNQVNEIKCL